MFSCAGIIWAVTTRSSDSIDLFVYGSLRDKRLLYELTGKTFSSSAATLEEFKKRTPPGGHPYILPDKGSKVTGLLIRGIDPESLRRLDRYEDGGRLYFRRRITVVCGKKRVACQAYIGNSRLHPARH